MHVFIANYWGNNIHMIDRCIGVFFALLIGLDDCSAINENIPVN